MLGPRLDGAGGVSLRPQSRAELEVILPLQALPEASRFWGPRFGRYGRSAAGERLRQNESDARSVNWSVYLGEEPVGFTGIFHIDWVRRDAETGIFLGRADLYGSGIATEALRLRTRYAREQLRLHRLYNYVALTNRGSRRASEKAGYREIGRFEEGWYRAGEWVADWLGEVLLDQP